VPAFRVVGVITGRRSEEAAALLGVPGVSFAGLYGMQEAAPELLASVAPLVASAIAVVPEAWAEDKGVSVAVHYRQAPDPAAARRKLVVALQLVATENGLELVEGKMVIELVPPDRPMKGATIERIAGEAALEAVLYAGDDVADIDGFAGLDRLEQRGLFVVRVAVRGAETPQALLDRADVAVEGPAGLVELLRQLA
jgi:trehalose 6-phosphate phosphatase